jgi:hypothetical protein
MTRHEDNESDEDIENSRFCFFQLLLVTCRYKHEPTCIDHEDDAHEHEESVYIRDDLTDDTNSTRDILVGDLATSDVDDICILTVRRPIE